MRNPYILKKLQHTLLLFLLLAVAAPAFAQVPPSIPVEQQAQLRQLLADKDIDEQALRTRLLAEGIDIDNASTEELVQFRPRIEAIIAEMQAEKEAATASEGTDPPKDATIDEIPEDGDLAEETTEEKTDAELLESEIYGHQVFRNKSLEVYQGTDNATPPESYPLKPGDEIAVSIFGASQTDFILRLDNNGFVMLPNGLRMPIGGVPLSKARTLLSNRLRNYYTFREGQLSIRMQVTRTVSINVFGEVERNGSYNMSALNTGFNALVAAGGPTERGSVRKIQLIRGEETIMLDVYDFLQRPIQKTDLFLTNNATIFVPVAECIVTIEGGVQRPMKYELLEGETLADLLAFAGDALPAAETSTIRVTRYRKGELDVLNVDLATNPGFKLQNGDLVQVPEVTEPIENFVTVEGAVLLPGRYAFLEGSTVAELASLSRLRPAARTDVAFLFRNNDDGTSRLRRVSLGDDQGGVAGATQVELQRGDVLRVLSQTNFIDQSTFTVEGAVRDSTVTLPFPMDGALNLEEAILLAGGTRANAAPEVMLIRTPLTNSEERSYQQLDLRTDGNTPLLPQDRILVYERERFSDRPTVSIAGAVRSEGVYTYDRSLSIRNLLYLAGGLRIDAARDRVEVFRLQINEGAETKTLLTTVDLNAGEEFLLQPFDEVIVRSAAEFEPIRNIVVEGEVRYPGNYALLQDNERLSDIVRRAGGLTQEAFAAGATLYRPDSKAGYVVLDLDRVILDRNDPANMVVWQGDTLFVPKQQDLISIYTRGTVASRYEQRDSTNNSGVIQVAYQGDKPASWYIKRYAGGFEDDIARKRWTTVQYANGQLKETSSFLGIHNYPEVLPGAIIRVPLKPEKIQKERREERFNWIGLAQVLVGAATTLTTFILLRR
jgi:protein involved in polysaccharide export with SLBB domain